MTGSQRYEDRQVISKKRIVVGVDGSEGSLDALRFAMEEAEATGAEVQAVQVWEFTVTWGAAGSWGAAAPYPRNLDEGDIAAKDLAEAVDKVLAERLASGKASPPVITSAVEGQAANELCREAEGARLLVVGSRGHGPFVGSLLGSVSHACVSHPPCPVVVMPDPRSRAHRHHQADDQVPEDPQADLKATAISETR